MKRKTLILSFILIVFIVSVLAGTLVGYAAMFGSLFLLCWKMKATRSFPFLALIWAVPFCSDWYGFILRVPYYIPFVVLELLLLTVLVSYVQSEKRNAKAALAVGSVLLSVLTGLTVTM